MSAAWTVLPSLLAVVKRSLCVGRVLLSKLSYMRNTVPSMLSVYRGSHAVLQKEVIPTCRERGIGIVAYSHLGRGFLTGTIKCLNVPISNFRERA